MERTITIGSELSLPLATVLWFIGVEEGELATESHFNHFLSVETDGRFVSFTAPKDQSHLLLDQFWNYIRLEGRDSGMEHHRARALKTALEPLGLYSNYTVQAFPGESHDHLISKYEYISRQKEHFFEVIKDQVSGESSSGRRELLEWCDENGVEASRFRPTLGEVADEVLGGMFYGSSTKYRRVARMSSLFQKLMEGQDSPFPKGYLGATQEIWDLEEKGLHPPHFPYGPIPEEWIVEICDDETVASLRSAS